VSAMRRYLEERGFVEVETPILQPLPGGALARPFVTHHNALDADLYLRIAPELYLKRLLVGGFDRVFEIGKNFRNEGISLVHNPEFTMMELYWAYVDYHAIMELVEDMIPALAREVMGTTEVVVGDHSIDLKAPWPRRTLDSLLSEYLGLSLVQMRADPRGARRELSQRNVDVADDDSFSSLVTPHSNTLCGRSLSSRPLPSITRWSSAPSRRPTGTTRRWWSAFSPSSAAERWATRSLS